MSESESEILTQNEQMHKKQLDSKKNKMKHHQMRKEKKDNLNLLKK